MRRHIATVGEDDIWFQLNQFRGQVGQTLRFAFSVTILDGEGLSVYIAKALQALKQRTNWIDLWRVEEQDREAWILSGLLRARSQWQRGRCTGYKTNELA